MERGNNIEEAATPAISIDEVSLTFRRRDRKGTTFQALADVSFEIAPNEIVAILGPSGCGKSTLLNLIAGFLEPTAGGVATNGRRVDGPNRSVGYVTQRDTLLPWRTIEKNLEVPLEIRGVAKAQRRERVLEELKRVNLQDFASYYPHQLSGGMRQRANLARTLIYEPDILLMDEPFGALDALMRHRLQQEVLDLWSRQPRTIVYVTHDIDEAIVLASRVLVMSRSPARAKAWFESPFPYPRTVAGVRAEERAAELRNGIWDAIREEIDGQEALS